jgi:hypothetical protein
MRTKSSQTFAGPATPHGKAWEYRSYSSYSFSTWALEGGELSASHPGRALRRGIGPPVPIVQEVAWVPEPVWEQKLEQKSSAFVGDRTPIIQSVDRHYTELPGSQYDL